jgi:hypothetical protein
VFGTSRGPAAALLLAAILVVGACGSDNPASPGSSANGSANPSGSGPVLGSAGPESPTPSLAPTAASFWQIAARALSKSGRLRLVITGSGTHELRFEPKASGIVTGGDLSSICVSGAAYTVSGVQSTPVSGKWACGASALASSFRKTGLPVYAWSTKIPADTKIKEVVTQPTPDHWQWVFTGTSKVLGGTVKTTLLLDPTTGRLLTGTHTDPTGSVRYTFSYTTIFAPIALP